MTCLAVGLAEVVEVHRAFLDDGLRRRHRSNSSMYQQRTHHYIDLEATPPIGILGDDTEAGI
jgi:hypothetical protein